MSRHEELIATWRHAREEDEAKRRVFDELFKVFKEQFGNYMGEGNTRFRAIVTEVCKEEPSFKITLTYYVDDGEAKVIEDARIPFGTRSGLNLDIVFTKRQGGWQVAIDGVGNPTFDFEELTSFFEVLFRELKEKCNNPTT